MRGVLAVQLHNIVAQAPLPDLIINLYPSIHRGMLFVACLWVHSSSSKCVGSCRINRTGCFISGYLHLCPRLVSQPTVQYHDTNSSAVKISHSMHRSWTAAYLVRMYCSTSLHPLLSCLASRNASSTPGTGTPLFAHLLERPEVVPPSFVHTANHVMRWVS